MPSKTPKQRKFMRVCKHASPQKRKQYNCPSRKVAAKFVAADKRK